MSSEAPLATPGRAGDWGLGRAFLVALAAILLVSFSGVFDHSLWTPDEPRDAEVGREMFVSGDYVVPTVAGEPFLEKPPLAWWVMAGSYRAFGVSDGAARSASALAGVLTLLLVFDLMRRVTDPFGALMATLVAATTGGFFLHFHRVTVDPWLALFVMLGYWAFALAAFPRQAPGSEGRARPSAAGIIGVYLACGLAFLVKGPVGVALLAAPVAAAVLAGRRWALLRSWAHVPGLLVFLALCLVWPVLLYRRGGRELLNGFLLDNLVYRFVHAPEGAYSGGHHKPFWYYLTVFPLEVLPWLIAFPALLHWLKQRRWPAGWNSSALLFLAAVFPAGLILLSIPATKRGLYLLPLLAPLGATVGAWIAATAREERSEKIDRGTQRLLLVLLAALLALATAAAAALYIKPSLLARYKPDLSAFLGSAATPVLLGLSAVALVGLGLRGARLWRRDPAQLGPLAVWMALTLFVLSGPLAFRAMDGFKNLHRMTAELSQTGALSAGLIGYNLDETTLSVIPFDTNVVPKNTDDPAALRRLMLKNPSGKLLVLERHLPALPADVHSRLRLAWSWGEGSHRAYRLYDYSPAPAH